MIRKTVLDLSFDVRGVIAYHYVRFSTSAQTEGDSLRRQIRMAVKWCEKHGYIYDESLRYEDLGVSGYTGEHRNRGSLAGFLRLVEQGRISKGSRLLVETWDRLSREAPFEQVQLLVKLIEAGIVLVHLASGKEIDRAILNTEEGLLDKIQREMEAGHYESQKKSYRLKSAWEGKREERDKILSANCPAWLRAKADRTGFDVIPERVSLVKKIIEEFLAGKGAYVIARELTQRGVPTWGRGKYLGYRWHKSFVEKILKSEALIGVYRPSKYVDGKPVPTGDVWKGYFPNIISSETWDRLRQKFQSKSSTPHKGRMGKGVANLFSGLAFAEGLTSKNGKTIPMILKHNKKSVTFVSGTGGSGWRYDHFEECVLRFLDHIDIESIFASGLKQQNQELQVEVDQLKSNLAGKDMAIKNLLRLAEEGAELPPSASQRLRTLENETKALVSRITALETKLQNPLPASVPTLKNLLQMRHDPDVRFRMREAIRDIVQEIIVSPQPKESFDEISANGTSKHQDVTKFARFNVALRGVPFSPQDATRRPTNPILYREFIVVFQNGQTRWVVIPKNGHAVITEFGPEKGRSTEAQFFVEQSIDYFRSDLTVPPWPDPKTCPPRGKHGKFVKRINQVI